MKDTAPGAEGKSFEEPVRAESPSPCAVPLPVPALPRLRSLRDALELCTADDPVVLLLVLLLVGFDELVERAADAAATAALFSSMFCWTSRET